MPIIIEDYEEIEEISQKLKSYAYLVYCTDQLDKERSKFFQFIEETVLEIYKDVIFFGIELNKLNEKNRETEAREKDGKI